MRIHFTNFGHADMHLKICKRVLKAHLPVPEGSRLPSQATRNAYCRAFGYEHYDELRLFYSSDSKPPRASFPSDVELHDALTRGFMGALAVVRERGIPCPDDSAAFANLLAKDAWEEIERRRIFAQHSKH